MSVARTHARTRNEKRRHGYKFPWIADLSNPLSKSINVYTLFPEVYGIHEGELSPFCLIHDDLIFLYFFNVFCFFLEVQDMF